MREQQTAPSAAEFRAACARFPTGVTVVTRRLPDERPYGMTVSSFASVSLDPQLLLVCIDSGAAFVKHLPNGLAFGINILNERQQHLAARFADRGEEDRFAGVDWEGGWNGVPLLAGVVASFVCTLDQVVKAGDHLILIGGVRHIEERKGGALVWYRSAYEGVREQIGNKSLIDIL